MELHPFLESDIRPAPKWWYVLAATGDCPSMRVGHSAVFVPARQEGEHNKVFIIGGANPSQVFSEVYVLDLQTRAWDFQESPGFRGRYEHASFTVDSHPGKIFIFGGATQTGNLNDVQSMDVNTGQWSDVETSGTAPSPRTHRCGAVVGNKFYVYSGGQSGPDPVADRKVHCLDMGTLTWSSLTPRGDSPPKPRHGHMMVVHNDKIFLHGGMAGSTFYDDLHLLDLDKQSWTCLKKKKSPPPRAAHDGLAHNGRMYVFGGMSKAGALDDAHTFDFDKQAWSKFELEGPAPANRLDFALCRVKMAVPVHTCSSPRDVGGAGAASSLLSDTRARAREVLDRELKPGSASSRDSDSGSVDEALYALDYDPTQLSDSRKEGGGGGKGDGGVDEDGSVGVGGGAVPVSTEEVELVLINGGMDTEGEIFDDTLVMLL